MVTDTTIRSTEVPT